MNDAVTLKRCRGVLSPTTSPHKGIHSPATKKKDYLLLEQNTPLTVVKTSLHIHL